MASIVVHSKHVLDYENIEGGSHEFDRMVSILYDTARDFFYSDDDNRFEADRADFKKAMGIAEKNGEDDVASAMQSILEKADPNCSTIYVEFWR